MADEKEAVVPVEPVRSVRAVEPGLIPETALSLFGGAMLPTWSSFAPNTTEGIALMDKCETEPDHKIKAMVNLELCLRDIYAHKVEIANQLGEIIPVTRTCLITTEGKVIATCSAGIAKSVLRLIRQHGLPTWKNGVWVKVNLRDIGEGRQWMDLTNAPRPAESGQRVRRP